jgi:predicted RND superfamily exporter protein
MRRILGFLSTHPWIILAVAVAATATAIPQIIDVETGRLRVEIDPSVDRLLPASDERVRFYHQARRTFGSDENFIISVKADELFVPKVFEQIREITGRLEDLPDVRRVVSITNTPIPEVTDEGVSLVPAAAPDASADEAIVEKIRQSFLADSIYRGTLLSRDGRTSAIIVSIESQADARSRRALDKAINTIVAEERGGLEVWYTGSPHLEVAMTDLLLNDLYRIAPIVVLVLALVLAISFRSLYGVLVPLLTVTISTIWTLALVVWLGYSLTMVTVLVPPLLLVLGLTYSVHVVSEHRMVVMENSARGDPLAETLDQVALPVALTGLTTVAGFLSLTISPLEAIREFGIFTVIGASIATVNALVVTPALLAVLRPSWHVATVEHPGRRRSWFDEIIGWVALFDYRAQTPILIGAAAIFVVGLIGSAKISVGFDILGNFPKDSEARLALKKTEQYLDGTSVFYVVVKAKQRDAWKQPAKLEELKNLQLWIENQPQVVGTSSIVDYLSALGNVFLGQESRERQVPSSKQQVSQMLFFGTTDDAGQFVDPGYRVANIVVRVRAVGSDVIADVVSQIDKRLQVLPKEFEATVTGYPVLIGAILDKITRGQIQSILLALAIVYGLLAALFLSFRIGFIALIPNMLPVIVFFGVLGIFGIPLSPGISVVAPMVLGLAIDDTIHYFTRFNREVKSTGNESVATVATLRHVGRPVTYTTLGLCLGFLALTTADVRMQVDVGIMAFFSLAFAWLADFVLTPALCARVRFVTLWDALSLDLGSKPQDTIGLFKGLSTFQARIFARMASIVNVPAGTRIIRYGEVGAEMFAVIDGQVEASIEGQSGRVTLGSYARGDVVGEAGLYGQRRTADVDITADARLLRISRSSLERLRARYPRIASKVLRNLNEALAQRLARATDRLA